MTSTPASSSSRTVYASADTPALHVEVADSIEACRRLREPWLHLREGCGIHSPNTDPDRFLAVVGALADARPHVVAFGPPHSPCAMLVARSSLQRVPFRIGYIRFRSSVLRVLDIVYEGLLTDGEPGSIAITVAYLAERLSNAEFDVVSFNHLRIDQAQEVALQMRHAVLDPPEPHWRFELTPGSYEQTIRGFSKKHRYNMRRTDRLLMEHFSRHVRLRVFARDHELDEFLSHAARITAQTYQGNLKVGLQDNPVTRAVLSADARAGRLRCYWLEANGEPIAHHVGCIHGNTYYLAATSFLPLYRELSPGQVLLTRVIGDLCTANVRWIDYGFGDADYKRIYGTDCWTEQSIRLYGRTTRATVAWILDLAATCGTTWLGAAAKRLGVAQRIKSAWRRRMPRG